MAARLAPARFVAPASREHTGDNGVVYSVLEMDNSDCVILAFDQLALMVREMKAAVEVQGVGMLTSTPYGTEATEIIRHSVPAHGWSPPQLGNLSFGDSAEEITRYNIVKALGDVLSGFSDGRVSFVELYPRGGTDSHGELPQEQRMVDGKYVFSMAVRHRGTQISERVFNEFRTELTLRLGFLHELAHAITQPRYTTNLVPIAIAHPPAFSVHFAMLIALAIRAGVLVYSAFDSFERNDITALMVKTQQRKFRESVTDIDIDPSCLIEPLPDREGSGREGSGTEPSTPRKRRITFADEDLVHSYLSFIRDRMLTSET
jgi:hypothetical protein